MAKSSDLVKNAVQELTTKLKDLKNSDEEDLGKLADMFDEISTTADKAAARLSDADRALSEEEEEEGRKEEEEEPSEESQDEAGTEDESESQDEEENKPQQQRRSTKR